MAKVLGIGGVFFKAADTAALGDWYRQVLGMEVAGWGGAVFEPPHGAAQVWSTFPADTEHFAPSTAAFMINLVVDDLDGVLARAQAAGVAPLGREDGDENGRFAWLLDPVGVKVELWEPNPDAAAA